MTNSFSEKELYMDRLLHKNLRRRTEDIEYWRKRAGWFDDDVSMKEFNNGVYDTYYNVDDDGAGHRGGSSSSSSGGFAASAKGLGTFIKIGAAVVAVIFAVLVFRALSRRSSSSRKVGSSSKRSSSDSRGQRSRSRSRSSRSRSRSRRASSKTGNYELMDDKSDTRSRKSSRSRSRSRRHSKSRKSRSRSKSRQNKEVLV